jgi:RimJ/RimL family protein N-acetyltransferase
MDAATSGTPLRDEVRLRPWRTDDLGLLERLLGDPAMTEHLGGPETPEHLRSRLTQYLALKPEEGRMFVVTVGRDGEPVGSVGWWWHEAGDSPSLETGWSVLREFQGRGIATRAMRLMLELVAADTDQVAIHAYPTIENVASNALCRTLGFELLGSTDFEYPKGHPIVCNDWSFDLGLLRPHASQEPHDEGVIDAR